MRLKRLGDVKRTEPFRKVLASMPRIVTITREALAKAFLISRLVRSIYQESFEWYGFTIGRMANPELVVDIGLPENDQNMLHYASISPQKIAEFQEALPGATIINGWIHSHGSLELHEFSATDDSNQLTVLDYVWSVLRKPVARKEILISNLQLLVKDRWTVDQLDQGSVSIITDAPVSEARIIETVYGGFCYGIVIGDDGWHRQEIYCKTRGILSGETTIDRKQAELLPVGPERVFSPDEIAELESEVRSKIQPISDQPQKLEKM